MQKNFYKPTKRYCNDQKSFFLVIIIFYLYYLMLSKTVKSNFACLFIYFCKNLHYMDFIKKFNRINYLVFVISVLLFMILSSNHINQNLLIIKIVKLVCILPITLTACVINFNIFFGIFSKCFSFVEKYRLGCIFELIASLISLFGFLFTNFCYYLISGLCFGSSDYYISLLGISLFVIPVGFTIIYFLYKLIKKTI